MRFVVGCQHLYTDKMIWQVLGKRGIYLVVSAGAVAQRKQVGLTRENMADQNGVSSYDARGFLAVDRDCTCIQLHPDGTMCHTLHDTGGLCTSGHESGPVARRVRLKAEQHAVRGGDVAQPFEKGYRNIRRLFVGQSRTIPVLG